MIIDKDVLDKIILTIEDTLQDLDYIEKKLIYDILIGRNQDKINKVKMQDSIAGVSIGGLLKKITKSSKKGEE